MSLFGSIQLGANTLRAMEIGLQVTGNNIANANTPGYVRQEVVYSPAPVQKIGDLILGLGVQVDGIVDKLDKFVQQRLVGARGDRAGAEIEENAYHDIESLINGLSGSVDLSSALTTFFNSISDVLDPSVAAARNLVIQQGNSLSSTIRNLSSRAVTIRGQFNDRITDAADEINNLSEEIRRLNVQISTVEGGGSSNSDAGGLRVQRQTAVDRLSEIVGITVHEQQSGSLNVSVGGQFLVFEGTRRAVSLVQSGGDNGISLGTVQFTDTQSALNTSSGELKGLYTARDEIAGNFLSGLDELAGLLANEFNKVYSAGQGLVGFDQLTGVNSVTDADAALDEAGLEFTPVNGAFQVLVHNKAQDITKTYDVSIRLNGLDDDTSLNDLAATLDAIDGISASVTSGGKLQLAADSTDTEFAFAGETSDAGDTSGVLAALGLNTFFTGSTARDIGVNAELQGLGNDAKFAASLGGLGRNGDTANAVKLAAFAETPLDAAGGATIPDVYDRLISSVSQGATVANSVAEGFRVFEGTLDGQSQAVSGVSLDEEAIRLITLQRIYQASARCIKVATDLLDILVDL